MIVSLSLLCHSLRNCELDRHKVSISSSLQVRTLLNMGSPFCTYAHRMIFTLCPSVSDRWVSSQLFREKAAIFWVIFILCIPRTLSSSLHMLSAISGHAIAGVAKRSITLQQPLPASRANGTSSRAARVSTPSTSTSPSCQPKMMYLQRDFRAV